MSLHVRAIVAELPNQKGKPQKAWKKNVTNMDTQPE
jgi:hypothetical protein